LNPVSHPDFKVLEFNYQVVPELLDFSTVEDGQNWLKLLILDNS